MGGGRMTKERGSDSAGEPPDFSGGQDINETNDEWDGIYAELRPSDVDGPRVVMRRGTEPDTNREGTPDTDTPEQSVFPEADPESIPENLNVEAGELKSGKWVRFSLDGADNDQGILVTGAAADDLIEHAADGLVERAVNEDAAEARPTPAEVVVGSGNRSSMKEKDLHRLAEQSAVLTESVDDALGDGGAPELQLGRVVPSKYLAKGGGRGPGPGLATGLDGLSRVGVENDGDTWAQAEGERDVPITQIANAVSDAGKEKGHKKYLQNEAVKGEFEDLGTISLPRSSESDSQDPTALGVPLDDLPFEIGSPGDMTTRDRHSADDRRLRTDRSEQSGGHAR